MCRAALRYAFPCLRRVASFICNKMQLMNIVTISAFAVKDLLFCHKHMIQACDGPFQCVSMIVCCRR